VPGFETVGHASHTSPLPSVSPSAWPGLERSGQLSVALTTPSPSRSFGLTVVQVVVLALTGHGSQTSPTLSLVEVALGAVVDRPHRVEDHRRSCRWR
jgi:hypothetical protein